MDTSAQRAEWVGEGFSPKCAEDFLKQSSGFQPVWVPQTTYIPLGQSSHPPSFIA